VVFVTHDIEESLYLADRVIMLGSSPGRIIQELRVPFARPRLRRTLAGSPEFQALQEQIAERFRKDTLQRIEAESVVNGEAEGI
jgi:NitT/TauT family transport system ATP-binding protein